MVHISGYITVKEKTIEWKQHHHIPAAFASLHLIPH